VVFQPQSRRALLFAGILLLAGGLFLSGRLPGGGVDELSRLALALSIIVSAAKLGGEAAVRLGQPPVLGELLAGVLLGNLPGLGSLDSVASDMYLDLLARLGMLLLLFEIGVELTVRELFEVGASSVLVATCGTLFSFIAGSGAAFALVRDAVPAVHVFLGAAITATSVGISARVLKDIGAARRIEARIILGAAVVDDVLALVVLALVTGWLDTRGSPQSYSFVAVLALVAKTVGFLMVAIVLGVHLTPRWFREAARLRTPGALLAAGLCFCFFLSWAASAIGLAPVVGAFAAGLVLEDAHSASFVERGERALGALLEPVTAFLVPLFFVLVGFRTNLRVLAHPAVLGLAAGLTVAAILGKLACAIGVVARRANRLTVATAMLPRGEVTLIYAALGGALQLGTTPLLDERAYSALVAVVIFTTLLTPPAVKWSAGRRLA
jgi:Kef-type K+ transport system membrane component KefB